MQYIQKVQQILQRVLEIAKAEGKLSGFCIGNTAKMESNDLYFIPIRNTPIMVTGGAVIYSVKQAIDIVKAIDGKVQYILVDAEKKISSQMSLTGEPANVERAVREETKNSRIWVYKGNDLSVDAVDALLTQLTKDSVQGIGGVDIAILGAGNLGTKLALKLVERGAHVTMTRRRKDILDTIVKAINFIKPENTTSMVIGTTDNEAAVTGAKILIGTTQGHAVITPKIVKRLADKAIILDVGKGTLCLEAIEVAKERDIKVYRLDVSAAFEGLIYKLWKTEETIEKKSGRRVLQDEVIVSGGILGRQDEIVVDDVWNPKQVYGIANGKGDFVRNLTNEQMLTIEKMKELIEKD